MSSGRATLQEIEHSIRQTREQEQALLAEMESNNAERVRLLEQRTLAYRELAEVRAENAIADGVIDEADQIERRVSSILQARQKTLKSLKARATRADKQRDELIAEADALRTEIAKHEAELDKAADKARAALGKNKAYQKLVEARDRAQATFKNADEKTVQSEQDRKEKGKAYETDPLFMYLWRRKYKSDDYQAGNIIRMLDGWVADYIGYHEARANYAVLNEIPTRLRAHCDNLKELGVAAQKAVDDAASEEIKKIAGDKLISDLAAARQRQDRINADLETSAAEVAEISSQLNRYAEGLDPSFQEAVDVSVGFLEQTSYRNLLRQARRTPEPSDDNIVERVAYLTTEAKKLEQSTMSRRKELERLAERREELLEMASKFRRRHYDDDGFEFEPDDFIEDLLEGIVRGTLRGGDAWYDMTSRGSWSGRSADPFRRQSGSPPFGRGGFGGSWGGGSRGGGFKTGGGF